MGDIIIGVVIGIFTGVTTGILVTNYYINQDLVLKIINYAKETKKLIENIKYIIEKINNDDITREISKLDYYININSLYRKDNFKIFDVKLQNGISKCNMMISEISNIINNSEQGEKNKINQIKCVNLSEVLLDINDSIIEFDTLYEKLPCYKKIFKNYRYKGKKKQC